VKCYLFALVNFFAHDVTQPAVLRSITHAYWVTQLWPFRTYEVTTPTRRTQLVSRVVGTTWLLLLCRIHSPDFSGTKWIVFPD